MNNKIDLWKFFYIYIYIYIYKLVNQNSLFLFFTKSFKIYFSYFQLFITIFKNKNKIP